MSHELDPLDPFDHMAKHLANGFLAYSCITAGSSFSSLALEHYTVWQQVEDGPLDAPDCMPAGGCYSRICPLFEMPYTSQLVVTREGGAA
ncbi:MAG: hypothetical protein KGZ67_12520 [Hydrogenophaga sp.]|jgi:hypothetical protein|nr:hypothetical protein [Hydrogenophaga sp.]